MIKIIINKKKRLITSLRIFGHSNYAEYGKDIVCSAVSGITQGMFNAIHKMCNIENVKIKLDPNKEIQGNLIVNNLDDKKLQILLRAMYYQLDTIRIQFPKYIIIKLEEAI